MSDTKEALRHLLEAAKALIMVVSREQMRPEEQEERAENEPANIPPSPHPASDSYKGTNPKNCSEKGNGISANWVAAIASCLMALFAWRAFDTSQRQLVEFVKQNRLDQRAWLCGVIDEHKSVCAGNTIYLTVAIKNLGKTPALHVQSYGGVAYTSNSVPNFGDRKMATNASVFVPPNGDTFSVSVPLRPSDVLALQNGETPYCCLIVWYDDFFKKEHWSRCCFKVLPNDGGFGYAKFANDCDPNY